jgi:hypothetical protein
MVLVPVSESLVKLVFYGSVARGTAASYHCALVAECAGSTSDGGDGNLGALRGASEKGLQQSMDRDPPPLNGSPAFSEMPLGARLRV